MRGGDPLLADIRRLSPVLSPVRKHTALNGSRRRRRELVGVHGGPISGDLLNAFREREENLSHHRNLLIHLFVVTLFDGLPHGGQRLHAIAGVIPGCVKLMLVPGVDRAILLRE